MAVKSVPLERKSGTSLSSAYTKDGQQAYYLLIDGDEQTWFTAADLALAAWESRAGAELWQGRSSGQLQKIR